MTVQPSAATYREPPVGEQRAFEERLAAVAGVRNAADAGLVEVMAEALGGDLWRGHRIHTPVQWLMWRAGVKRATARQVVLLAARAGELPTTVGLLREGRLSLDQAATVARYTPAAYEESVCGLAVNATVAQIAKATRGYDFDVEASEPRERSGREVSFGQGDDGEWWARIRLPADEGQVVEAALQATRDRLHDTERGKARERAESEGRPTGGTDAELGVPRIGWADALVGMAHSVLGTGAEGAEAGTRVGVQLHLERPANGEGEAWLAELHGGPALPSWLRLYLLCDCDIEIVWESDGVPVSTSKHHRTPPRRIRRLIEHRDGYRCRVPGCDQTLWLQVHHVIHWEDDGETLSWNLCCLCAHHHRMHHQGLLAITGNADAPPGAPDELAFTDTIYGRRLEPAGRPVPPQPDDMPDAKPYDGPTGECLQTRWVDFTATPPGAPPDQVREPAA